MTVEEFKALFGDSNLTLTLPEVPTRPGLDYNGKTFLQFGIEKRGLASLSDLKIILEAMGEDVTFFDTMNILDFNNSEVATDMETNDRKLLLSFSDFRRVMLELGMTSAEIDLIVDPIAYGPMEISDLRLSLITRCSDYVAPDKTAPVITITGANPTTINPCGTYVDEGATATDDVDGDVTSDIITINNVVDDKIGTYGVIYRVKDAAGNEAEAERIVYVVAGNCP